MISRTLKHLCHTEEVSKYGFYVPLDATGHFRDESFQAITLVLTTKLKTNTRKYAEIKHKNKTTKQTNWPQRRKHTKAQNTLTKCIPTGHSIPVKLFICECS